MKDNILTIKRLAQVSFTGQMGESTRAGGQMENNTEWVPTLLPAEKQSRGNGKRAKGCIGSIIPEFELDLQLFSNNRLFKLCKCSLVDFGTVHEK